MGHEKDLSQSFLRSLARDTSANTLAIAAATLVPLVAMVGGAVDASRYYMADARLQAACDAGALAARRAMDDNEFTNEHRDIGLNFFDQNFRDGMFGSTDLERSYIGTADGEVLGTATGNMPATIMAAFGYENFDLGVECQADINISNTDVMFVFDTTGSMAWATDGTNCGFDFAAGLWNECPNSRIQALRNATLTFFDTVEDSTSNAAQVRYGLVPYSSNVNVGAALVAENPGWLAQAHTYQSRVSERTLGDFETTSEEYIRTGDATNIREVRTINNVTFHSTFEACVAHFNDFQEQEIFVSSNQAGWTQVSISGTNPRTIEFTGPVTYETFRGAGGTYFRSSGRCDVNFDVDRFEAESTIIITEEAPEIWEWVYRGDVEHNLAGLYDDNRVEIQTGWANTFEEVEWDGCVEEADTAEGATVFNPVPAEANDLNINLIPSREEEFWKPVLREAVWRRRDASGANTLGEVREDDPTATQPPRPSSACPQAAARLEEVTRGELQTFVNNLVPNGATYHDVGMIWGGRFLSPRGIFQADNETAPNGDAIARHLVFLTDGELDPNVQTYNMYGVEWWDRRISGDGVEATAFSNHAERFQAACRAAQQENIRVWVVAFGVNLTQNLIDCANPGSAFAAGDAAELESRFREIAQQIAALRLTQ